MLGSASEGFDPPAFPSARLGPRPARPSCAPTAVSAPCPSRLLHPARCAQGLFLGLEVWRLDVSLLRAAVLVVASLPRTSRKKRAFPLMSGGAASAGGFVFPPCMRHRRSACATSRGEAPRAPSVAFLHRAGQRAALWRCTVRLLQRPREQGRGRPVSAAHAASPGASLCSSECASNGQRVEEAWL